MTEPTKNWWQVYQDRCEGAWVEATIVKELKRDIGKLKESAENWKAADRDKFDKIVRLRAEVAKLNNKFPCGHRIIDWDDSYGECVFCKIQQQAFDYDKLPHSVIECHDKIEQLEDERDAAVAEVVRLTAELGEAKEAGKRYLAYEDRAHRRANIAEAERDAAVVQGLAKAQTLALANCSKVTRLCDVRHEELCRACDIANAIAAEIAKRQENT